MSVPGPDPLTALDDALRHGTSATRVLESWCRDHGLAGRMHIRRLDRPAEIPPAEPTGLLHATALRYRHIRMFCGDIAVSEAENWYDAAILTDEMNAVLDRTDTPFGIAVAALGFQRRTLASRQDARGLEHRAALFTTTRPTPFCVVVEHYGIDATRTLSATAAGGTLPATQG